MADLVRRSDRMERVRSLAENEEQSLCRAMGEAQLALDAHENRLEELKNYRRDYAGKPPGQGAAISSARYADYRSFLSRLDEAVSAQADAVLQSRQLRDAHRRRWLEKRRKMESLKKVVERYRDDEDRAEASAQQKLLDDLPRRPDPFRER